MKSNVKYLLTVAGSVLCSAFLGFSEPLPGSHHSLLSPLLLAGAADSATRVARDESQFIEAIDIDRRVAQHRPERTNSQRFQ